ncbi:MAG: 3'-5' exonuclease [Deltaproteobacteria bacterium]|nr:3'-5' exonuclease [Deltaproteobacteria bacterium]
MPSPNPTHRIATDRTAADRPAPYPTLPPGTPLPASFVALDFETADAGADSACAVGLVRVEDGLVTDRIYRLIRPPRREVPHAFVHGLSWGQLRKEPTFARIWPQLAPLFEDAGAIAAHNASFDSGVLLACCELAGVIAPAFPWVCTVELARETWALPSCKLPAVAAHLGIALDHHHALSDAEACARILLAVRKRRVGLDPGTQ